MRTDSHDVDAAERAVRELLQLRPAPTALLATNNRITIGALRALRDLAEPPALVGFDDFDLADLLGVTVVAHDAERMGELGAELVIARLAGDRARPSAWCCPPGWSFAARANDAPPHGSDLAIAADRTFRPVLTHPFGR